MKISVFAVLASCLLLLQRPAANAQQPGGVDPAFTPTPADSQVLQIVARPKGLALATGLFSTVNGTPVGPLVQLKSDGSLDLNFANTNEDYFPTGDNGAANIVVATDAFDRIYVALTTTPSYTATLVRLYANGTTEPTFHATVDGPPSAMVALPNGQIIIAGGFSTLNGVTVPGQIARLNADGSTDNTFDPTPRPGVPSYDYAYLFNLAVQADGKVIIGGGILPNNDAGLTRLNTDGSRDTTFALSDLPNTTFQNFVLQPDGNLLVTYNTSTFGNQPYPYAVRIKTHSTDGTDGQIDSTFQPGNALPTFPRNTLVQSDGKIVFSLGTTIVRLNADGSADRTFSFGAPANATYASAGAQTTDGNLLISGTVLVNDLYVQGVARLLGSVPGGAATVNVVVPGTSNIWLARDGSNDIADSVPVEAPVRVVDLALTAGSSLVFTADGKVDFSGNTPSDGPDGRATFPEHHAAENGVSGINAPLDALVGVFIDDATIDSIASLPTDPDFSDASSRDFATLQPALGQVFYIGDGLTSSGAAQQFTVPTGAAHLVLGTVDGLGWYNNTGAFEVTITPGSTTGTGGGSGSLLVPGTANVWLAGQENGILASRGADQSPAQSPVQVPNLTLNPNQGLILSVGGLVTTGGGSSTLRPPDGSASFVTHADENNVAGTTAPLGSLVGVFVGDNAPTSSSLPSDPDFSFIGTGNSAYSPRLQQVFFIGDGKDASGQPQTFYPPKGATRLFLGVMDNTATSDNHGQFNVGVTTSALDPTDLRVGEHVEASSAPGGNGSYALLGDVLTYTFSLHNESKVAYTHTVLHDVLPSHIDLSKTVAFQGGTISGGIVTWNLGTIDAGTTVTRTLQVTVGDAPLGTLFYNKSYYASADGLPNVDGLDFPDTLIESAVSVKIANNGPISKPGGTVQFIYDLANTTPTTFKKLTLTVPILNGLLYGDAYFVDSHGTRLPVDTTGKTTAVYNQQSNSVTFTINALKNTNDVFLALEVAVPYNYSPTGTVSLPGAQIVVSKYTNGQPITFALADSSTPLSGQPADAPPSLILGKTVLTGDLAGLLLAVNPNAATLLNAIALKPFLDLNPNPKFVAQLGNFTSLLALEPDQIAQVINPYVGSDTDPDTNATVSTVPEPSAKLPSPFVTFALAYTNVGTGKATAVTIYDSAPKGLAIDPDSFFVNGAPVAQSTIQFNGDGSFSLTVKSLKNGKGGVVFYRAKVLAPADPPNGVPLGAYIEPTSAQMTIANLTSEVIAPAPDHLLLTGPAHAYASSTQTGDTAIGGSVIYTILYQNDGGVKITDFRVVSPVPPGGKFVSAQFLDLNQQHRDPSSAKGEFLDAPASGATSGLAVFHLGKVKTRGLGLVQVTYQLTAAVLQQTGQALKHQAYIAATGGLPTTSALAEHSPLRRQLRSLVPRDAADGSVGASSPPNTSHATDNPNGPHIGMTVACMQSVNTGDTLGYTVTAISLGNTNFNLGIIPFPYDPLIAFFVPIPDGTQFAGATAGVTTTIQTGTDGKSYVTGYLPVLPNEGASFVTVNFRPTGATRSIVHSPDIVLYDVLSGTTLHSGPINTTVTTPSDFFNLNLLVAQNTLNSVSTTTFSGTGFKQRVDQINSASRFTAVIGADYLSLENGVLIVPTAEGNIVAQGGGNIVAQGGGNIVAQGGGNIVAQGGGNIVAQGGGNLITIKNIVDGKGQLINQDGNSVANIFAGIVAQGGGNIVAQGGGNIVAQGGGNLQSVGVKVISNDGGSFAASADKALAAGKANFATVTQLTSSTTGEVFLSATDSLTFAGSGYVSASAGGAIKLKTGVVGTEDYSTVQHFTASAAIVRGGSGSVINTNGSN